MPETPKHMAQRLGTMEDAIENKLFGSDTPEAGDGSMEEDDVKTCYGPGRCRHGYRNPGCLANDVKKLRAFIQQAEWAASSCNYEKVPACPWCGAEEPGPHYTKAQGFHVDCTAAKLMNWKMKP